MWNLKNTVCQITLFVFTVLTIQAQEPEKNSSPKWSIGLSFSPDYCYRILKSEYFSPVMEYRDETEIPKFGYTAGIGILRRLHRKLELESGICYSDKGYKTDKQNLSWVNSELDLPSKYSIVYRYQYFEIPVKLNYYLLNRKILAFLTGGASVGIFNRQQTKLILEHTDGSKNSTLSENDLGFSALNFSIFVGGGILCPVSKSWSIRMQPLCRMALTPLRPTVGLKEKLFSTGLEVGFYYTVR